MTASFCFEEKAAIQNIKEYYSSFKSTNKSDTKCPQLENECGAIDVNRVNNFLNNYLIHLQSSLIGTEKETTEIQNRIQSSYQSSSSPVVSNVESFDADLEDSPDTNQVKVLHVLESSSATSGHKDTDATHLEIKTNSQESELCDLTRSTVQKNSQREIDSHVLLNPVSENLYYDRPSSLKFASEIIASGCEKIEPNRQNAIRSFNCNLCKKSFKTRYHLNRHHIEIHTNAKKFKCKICDKSFKRKDHLSNHTFSHQKKQFKLELLQQGIVVRK